MNPYNDDMIEMLSSHIIAKEKVIQTLADIIKDLANELKDVYTKLKVPSKKKGPAVKSVFRWELEGRYYTPYEYDRRDRAVGIVTKDGFFEFARYLNGVKKSRTHYVSVDEWMLSLPPGEFTRKS